RRAPSPARSIDRRTTEALFEHDLIRKPVSTFRDHALAQLVERVPPVAGVGTHLAGPAPCFGGLRPFPADQNMRPIDLVERGIARTILRDPLLFAADIQDERLTG